MIHDLDLKNQVLRTNGFLRAVWKDEFTSFNKSHYGDLAELIVPQGNVWRPDLFVENTARDYQEMGLDAMLVRLYPDGTIVWEPGILMETSCEVNIKKYPFDTQTCDIRVMSWMYTNSTLIIYPDSDEVGLFAYVPNGEWDIVGTKAENYSQPTTYGVNEYYMGVRFLLHLSRKRTFYVLSTIVPVMMLSILNVLVFCLPATTGEKMTVAVTVLLSFTVFLSVISEIMPKTSESISILAVYLTTLLAIATLSVMCSGVVLNMHHKDPMKPVPPYLKKMVRMILGEHPRRRISYRSREFEPSYRTRDVEQTFIRSNTITVPLKSKSSENGCATDSSDATRERPVVPKKVRKLRRPLPDFQWTDVGELSIMYFTGLRHDNRKFNSYHRMLVVGVMDHAEQRVMARTNFVIQSYVISNNVPTLL